MKYIKVRCEYDFGGSFGGNNNEEICAVADNTTDEEVEDFVMKYLMGNSGFEDKEDLKGMYGWEYHNPVNL